MLNYSGYLYFKNSDYEWLKDPDDVFYIKDLVKSKFYKKHHMNVKNGSGVSLHSNGWDYFCIFWFIFSIASFVYFIYNMMSTSANFDDSQFPLYTLVCLLLLFVNVVLHEFSHAFVLKMFGQKVSKIGFKMNFIFPTITVDTSGAYLLPRLRRLFVFIAGLESNLIFIALFASIFPSYYPLVLPIFWASLASLVPIGAIKTDGYNILFNAILKKDEMKSKSSIRFMVGKITFIFIVTVLIVLSVLRLF